MYPRTEYKMTEVEREMPDLEAARQASEALIQFDKADDDAWEALGKGVEAARRFLASLEGK